MNEEYNNFYFENKKYMIPYNTFPKVKLEESNKREVLISIENKYTYFDINQYNNYKKWLNNINKGL